MLMTVASRATISWATEMHTSASQRREDCAACGPMVSVLSGGCVAMKKA